MCGRLACTLDPEHLEGACSYLDKNFLWTKPKWIKTKHDYKPFYNGPPTTTLPVLTHKSHFFEDANSDYPEYVLVPMRWSMTIPGQQNSKSTYHTHNARLESLMQSPLYSRNVSEGRRCVIIADGFYEWQTTQGETKRQPYFIYKKPWFHSDEGEMHWDKYNGWTGKYMIKLAGVFNIFEDEDGYYCSCSVITTESNDSFSWLHHRMPVLCDYDYAIQDWVNKKSMSSNEVINYLESMTDVQSSCLPIKYYPVDASYVNNSKLDHPKCMENFKLRNKTLDSWFATKKL